jgi:dolichol-phosphate mannosyltransferase
VIVTPELQVILPVHNEGAGITTTLEEWYEQLSPLANFQFIVAEDGSKDDTREKLHGLATRFPISLNFSDKRRGYAGAMIAGMQESVAPYVLAVDADGQFDPKDFLKFWQKRHDLPFLIGWRQTRADVWLRKVMSWTVKMFHHSLFATELHDASCGYVLMTRETVLTLLPDLGKVPEGFWLEVTAIAKKRGIPLGEVPINHRARRIGTTVVYKPWRLPAIAWRNTRGLLSVWLT